MKKIFLYLTMLCCAFMLVGCAGKPSAAARAPEAPQKVEATKKASPIKIKITVQGRVLEGTLEDNATSRDFVKKLPTTLKMENLYAREMCFHYGPGGLREDQTRSDGYAVGDLIYWPPRGSFVILYKQNGEEFTRVHMGKVRGDLSLFEDGKDKEVRFELGN